MDRETFLNYICFKYIITNFSTDEIIDMLDEFGGDEPYEEFYDLIAATDEIDPDFFIIDESIIDKTQTIISEYRFQDRYRINNPYYDEMFNEIIVYLNEMRSLVNKNKVEALANYSINEMQKRNITVHDLDTLVEIISLDYKIYADILHNHFDETTKALLGETTNYFLESCPEVYRDPLIYQNTINMLETIDSSKLPKNEKKHRENVIKRMINLK